MRHSRPTLFERSVDLVMRQRMALFLIALLATAIAIVPSTRLSTDRSIASFFPASSALIADYYESKRLFGGDEIVIVAYRDPQLYLADRDEFDERRLAHIEQFANRLSNVEGVQAHGTQDLASTVGRAQKLAKVPLLAPLKKRTTEMVRRILVGDDNQTTSILLRLEPEGAATVAREHTIARIRQLAEQHAVETGLATYVIGEPVQVHDMFRYVEEDGIWLGWRSLAVLGVAALGLFRSPRWLVLPVLMALVAVWWTRAAIMAMGMRLTIMSSTIQTLIAMAAAAVTVHLAVHFHELRDDRQPRLALRDALARLAAPFFWGALATAAGFGLLGLAHIHPIRNYGLMMTVGSLLALLALAVLVPAPLLWGRLFVAPNPLPGLRALRRRLIRQAEHLARWRAVVLAAAAVLFLASGLGIGRLHIETEFARNFRPGSSTSQALKFAEAHLGGSGMWEVNFPAPEVLDEAYLQQVRLLAEKLRRLPADGEADKPALTKVVSITDGIDMIPRIPFLVRGLTGQLDYLQKLQPDFVMTLHNAQARRMRFMLRSLDRQPLASKLALIARVEAEARSHFPAPDAASQARATGLFVLLACLVEHLGRDQWIGAAVSATAVTGVLIAAQGSLRVGLVALAPNLWALAVVMGVMGAWGIPLNFATGILASIGAGLTADTSLHYLQGLRLALREGKGLPQALFETHGRMGSVLIYANLSAMAVALALTTAHFIPLTELGLLLCITLAAGLVGHLVLLPAMLVGLNANDLLATNARIPPAESAGLAREPGAAIPPESQRPQN